MHRLLRCLLILSLHAEYGSVATESIHGTLLRDRSELQTSQTDNSRTLLRKRTRVKGKLGDKLTPSKSKKSKGKGAKGRHHKCLTTSTTKSSRTSSEEDAEGDTNNDANQERRLGFYNWGRKQVKKAKRKTTKKSKSKYKDDTSSSRSRRSSSSSKKFVKKTSFFCSDEPTPEPSVAPQMEDASLLST